MINGEELQNNIKVWRIAVASLLYCYYFVKQIPHGIFRLFFLLPIFYLFITTPLLLSSVLIGGLTTFYLVWVVNFKLLLFAFNHGPLAPPLSLLRFISTALMPIKTSSPVTKSKSPHGFKGIQTSSTKIYGAVIFAIKSVIFAVILWIFRYREYLNSSIITILYCCQLYLTGEMVLSLSVAPVRAIAGMEMEPVFNDPYLSTSLQDFWGRRWNLMVTGILRSTVYDPVRIFVKNTFGRRWSLAPAFMASFLVSGIMHEVLYYYVTRVSPTWEVTWFFVLHGVCTACEVAIKKALNGRWQLHPAVSGLVTIGFLVVTASWLFFPQLTRNGIDFKILDELRVLSTLSWNLL